MELTGIVDAARPRLYRGADKSLARPTSLCISFDASFGLYNKTCLKRNAIVPVFFSVFTGFRFTKGCVLIKRSTKNMIA